MRKEAKENFDFKHLLLQISGGFFGLYLFALFVYILLFSVNFAPNVKVAGISISGMDKEKAGKELATAWEAYSKEKIFIEDKEYLVSDLVDSVNYTDTLEVILEDQKAQVLFFGGLREENHVLKVVLDDEAIYQILSKHYNKDGIQAVNPRIILSPTLSITQGKVGERLLLVESREEINKSLSEMRTEVSLRREIVKPNLSDKEALDLAEDAKKAVSSDILLNKGDGTNYKIEKKTLENWLKVEPTDVNTIVENDDFGLEETRKYRFLDRTKVGDYVISLASKIDKTAQNAKLKAADGQVLVEKPAVVGAKLNLTRAAEQIQEAVIDHETKRLEIELKEPEVTEGKLDELGLREQISVGWSDFKGSPNNRVHNFKTGASKFNGVLIRPDESFSFNKTLGEVTAETGYLPELVILENKTIPQYGGGLCQVSSTAFRAALNAGMPILERLNHAYPVVYYQPYGVDATIYLPKPDLVFKNDTGNYVLIQTKIEGTKLFFEFYGTKANRTIKFSGNEKADKPVEVVEKITPSIYDQDLRGKGSFSALFYRHIYDTNGKLVRNDKFVSKYDSPDKYPH